MLCDHEDDVVRSPVRCIGFGRIGHEWFPDRPIGHGHNEEMLLWIDMWKRVRGYGTRATRCGKYINPRVLSFFRKGALISYTKYLPLFILLQSIMHMSGDPRG